MYTELYSERISIKILLVDDDEDDILLFLDAIKNIQVSTEVITAKNGLVALKFLQSTGNHLPNLIFLDLHMPAMSGIELLRIIKTNNLYNLIPCIILTSDERKSCINEAFDSGANLFVIKPIDYKKLVKIIAKVLEIDWKDYFPPKQELFHIKEEHLQ